MLSPLTLSKLRERLGSGGPALVARDSATGLEVVNSTT